MKKGIVDFKIIVLIFAMGLFVIGVTDICSADAFFDRDGSTATRSVDENAAVGTDVGSAFSAKNLCFDPVRFKFPDHNAKFEYVVSDQDEIYYSIQIKTKVSFDYETRSSYTVRLIIEYYDYLFLRWIENDRVTVTININDVADGEATGVVSEAASTADALPTFSSEYRERVTSFMTLDTVIFNELFNASNDSHDWMELRNVTTWDVDLNGWHLMVVTDKAREKYDFGKGTVLPAGELLLLLNTDPDAPEMPLATSNESSYHYLVDEAFTLPQEDFILLLRSPSAWEDSAGSYLFGEEKLPTTVDFALDTAWFRAKSTVLGHQADAWVESGYQKGLGYDEKTSKTISLGTPGYPHGILVEDVNGDGIVNILDLVLVVSQAGESSESASDVNGDGMVNMRDVYMVARKFGSIAAAPSVESLTAAQVEQWLKLAKQEVSRQIQTSEIQHDLSYERGIHMLEQLLQILLPQETALLANYPNPFNPETWIPYQLATAGDVQITIYDGRGTLVRQFDLGHQSAGIYQSRSRAAYWDGRNALGESVASGIYFYTLTTEDFSATRKMLILK